MSAQPITTGISIPSQNAAWLMMICRPSHASIEAACNSGSLNQSRDWICLQTTNWKRIRRNECRISVANAAAPSLPSPPFPSIALYLRRRLHITLINRSTSSLILHDETDCRKYEVNGMLCDVFRESAAVFQPILCEDTACIPNCCKK